MGQADPPTDIIIVNDSRISTAGPPKSRSGRLSLWPTAGIRVTVFAAVPPILPELLSHNVAWFVPASMKFAMIPIACGRPYRESEPIVGRRHGRILAEKDRRRTIVAYHGWTKALSSSAVRAAIVREFP